MKGQSGNPAGRSKTAVEIAALARELAPEAIAGLRAIANDTKVSPIARVAAFNGLLDRGLGKPPQGLVHDLNVNSVGDVSGEGLTALLMRARAANNKDETLLTLAARQEAAKGLTTPPAAKPDFIVPSSGAPVRVEPEPAEARGDGLDKSGNQFPDETQAIDPEPEAEEPEPEEPELEEPEAPAPSKPAKAEPARKRAKSSSVGILGFSDYHALREREREEARKKLPGGQLHAKGAVLRT